MTAMMMQVPSECRSPDSSYASSASNSGSESSSPPRCEISLLERLIRTHPLWFLPSLQRNGALHLLQGRDVGNFIVRNSREPDTMALSTKLPGNQVEHYLLKATEDNRIALQDSEHSFATIHQLIAHYCENNDEIPVRLKIPSAVGEATTRQQLRSLALLGQEFWTLSSPPLPRDPILDPQGSPPSDGDSSRSHPPPSKSSGIGSHSSSSQNSLTDLSRRPCRPTTLELGRSRTLLSLNGTGAAAVGGSGTGTTPLSVPLVPQSSQWLSPTTFSQPSSMQSTPSEMQSTMSDRVPRATGAHRKKKNAAMKSIHYKDTEIIDLFKDQTKPSILDDKIKDYDEVLSHPHTPITPTSSARPMFTFKPDIIPHSTAQTPDFDPPSAASAESHSHRPISQSKSLSVCVTPTNGNLAAESFAKKTFVNNRLSLKNINVNLERKEVMRNNGSENNPRLTCNTHSLYSEPVDSVRMKSGEVINNRWSQPAMSLTNGSSQGILRNRTASKSDLLRNSCPTSQSTDSLNREISDRNIILKCEANTRNTFRPLTPSWQVDKSWQFCSNSNNKADLLRQKNINNLKLNLKQGGNNGDGNEQPLSPSQENWDQLMQLMEESAKQLEALEMKEDEKQSFLVSTYHCATDAEKSIHRIVETLASQDNGVFGPMLRGFISCTLSGKLQDPFKVLRNIRQFISGMKNYLVGVSPESERIHFEIKRQTERLKPSEFLNVDLILENILVNLVIRPLYSHVMALLHKENRKSHIRCNLSVNENGTMKFVRIYEAFEDSVSPMAKLDKWNEFVCEVQEVHQNSADFIPILTHQLASVCSPTLESHVVFMVALLPPCISERNAYSISLLQSAVSNLKCGTGCTKQPDDNAPGSYSRNQQSAQGCVKVIVPDERNGTLIRKVVPVRETTTTKEVTKILSSKLGIPNAADYVLVTLRSGEEKICHEDDVIHDTLKKATSSALAYRRHDAKIGWPLQITT